MKPRVAWLVPLAALLAPAGGARADQASVAEYFAELARAGIIDPQTGSRDLLRRELDAAEEKLALGDPSGAAMALYELVESPRFTDFADFPEYQNAEYDLAVALYGSGAYDGALAVIERVLARGPGALYWSAAHRRAVDIALESRQYAPVLARLEGVKSNEPIPPEATGERAYLRARDLYQADKLADAEGELTRISRKSRLYTSALYLRGIIRARRGEWKDSTEALCEIVDTPDSDRYTFVVDDRYFTIKDLARLGLGRVAHEEGRFEDAYYHYFQIPEDSQHLAEALFEAAWSMYQKRELGTARDLAAEFLASFPDSPLVLEALLLTAYIELADCQFDEAGEKFAVVVREMQPLWDVADAIQKSPEKQRAFFERAIAREQERRRLVKEGAAPPRARNAQDRVLAFLELDPSFVRLHDAAIGLRREAGQADQAATWWRLLARRAQGGGVRVVPVAPEPTAEQDDARAAAELLADVRRLADEVEREERAVRLARRENRLTAADANERLAELGGQLDELRALEDKAASASANLDTALTGVAGSQLMAYIAKDLDESKQLGDAARATAARIDAELMRLTSESLARLTADLRRVLDKAKLGKIDAVIGQKRKLELEIEDLAQGRYPPELFYRLYELGLIGDDEEYWPPEGEFWADEYEGFR